MAKRKFLESLLPAWAIKTDKALDYGVELGKPGLYYTMNADGWLTAVGLARLSTPPSWYRGPEAQIVICVSVLQIRIDETSGERSGFSRTRTVGTTYKPKKRGSGGQLVTINGYNDDDDITTTSLSFNRWAARDIRKMIEFATRDRG